MEEKHTPGPWNIVRYGDGSSLVIHSDADNRVCFMATASADRPTSHAAIRANAALIAAAPDLYEAAENLMQWYGIMEDGPDDSDEALANTFLVIAINAARAALLRAVPKVSPQDRDAQDSQPKE